MGAATYIRKKYSQKYNFLQTIAKNPIFIVYFGTV
jgi:hypothetical protein